MLNPRTTRRVERTLARLSVGVANALTPKRAVGSILTATTRRPAIRATRTKEDEDEEPLEFHPNMLAIPVNWKACDQWTTKLNRFPVEDDVYRAQKAVNWKKILDKPHYKILRLKGNEPRHTITERGGWDDHFEKGTYLCAGCAANGVKTALYLSDHKFGNTSIPGHECNLGWPSFWSNVEDNVRASADYDHSKWELNCAVCCGHLGHVHWNEGYNNVHKQLSNERHRLNGIALAFLPDGKTDLADRQDTTYKGTIFLPYSRDYLVLLYSGFSIAFIIGFNYYLTQNAPAYKLAASVESLEHATLPKSSLQLELEKREAKAQPADYDFDSARALPESLRGGVPDSTRLEYPPEVEFGPPGPTAPGRIEL